jgi:hypothetical protein
VLGLPENADWDDIQAAYERLTLRSDPRRFPDGSSSQHEARRITERIHAAYERLRDRYDPTESRFAKLEFDAPTPENTPTSTPPRPAHRPAGTLVERASNGGALRFLSMSPAYACRSGLRHRLPRRFPGR